MSGQSSKVFEQQPNVEPVENNEKSSISEQADPIAAFLEKHGTTMVEDHEGQLVTVPEAYANCPPFARLVNAMGEGALSLVASKHPEKIEEKVQNEEAEDKEEETEQKAGAVEPAMSSDDAKSEIYTAEDDSSKAEPLQLLNNSEQDSAATSVNSDAVEFVNSAQTADRSALLSETVKDPSSEKITLNTAAQNMKPSRSKVLLEVTSASGEVGASIDSNGSGRVAVVAKTAHTMPVRSEHGMSSVKAYEKSAPIKAEGSITSKAVVEHKNKTQKAAKISKIETVPDLVEKTAEVTKVEVSDAADHAEEFVVVPEKNSYMDKLADDLDSKIDTEADSTEVNLADAPTNGRELKEPIVVEEQRKLPEVFVDLETSEDQVSEDIITPAQEVQALKVPEFIQTTTEIVAEISVPIEEMEQFILQAADRIEEMGVKETETVHKMLDELVQKITEAQNPVESDSKDLEAVIETAEAEEELKELFKQLFDHVEIEYSPKLIESCVNLALQGNLSDLIPKIEQENVDAYAAQGTGTHEVITQLLATISSIKKSIQHAYQLGKSTLQLYCQKLLLPDLNLRQAYEAA
jgi:hypothetical protein